MQATEPGYLPSNGSKGHTNWVTNILWSSTTQKCHMRVVQPAQDAVLLPNSTSEVPRKYCYSQRNMDKEDRNTFSSQLVPQLKPNATSGKNLIMQQIPSATAASYSSPEKETLVNNTSV